MSARSPTRSFLRFLAIGAAAKQCPHAGQKFVEGERLGQVVVGAAAKTVEFVLQAVFGGQHQDHAFAAGSAQRAADVETVETREHAVEHDERVGILPGKGERLATVFGKVYEIPLCLQSATNEARDPHIVFNKQHFGHWISRHSGRFGSGMTVAP